VALPYSSDLALALLVLGIFATDHHHHAPPPDDLAAIAARLYRCLNLHANPPPTTAIYCQSLSPRLSSLLVTGMYVTLCPSAMSVVRNATMPLNSWTHVQHAPSRTLVLRRLVASGDTRAQRAIARNAISIFASPVATAPPSSRYLRDTPRAEHYWPTPHALNAPSPC
jgi:hypothetical protein